MARRLAAIMFTDIAGYTALSQADERGALRLLQEQEALVWPLLELHRGRHVKSMGDGLLIEFPDALDAVECAVDLQRHVQERNAREGATPLRLRIGIHLGDVEGVGTDILGDAVNVASRIEPLAEPGGVCVSEPVYAQVRNKVPYRLEELGPKSVKGVQEPIAVYRVSYTEAAGPSPAPTFSQSRIAVLPLANISPDPKDEYFADGLTEELITTLSQLSELRVIARTSVLPYKSNPKPISQVGSELGVGSVLEGSVRKAGDKLRITVQLIEVRSQEHRWAQTYDRTLDDVFAVQADVARQIAQVLRLKVRTSEEARLGGRPAVRPESYLAYLRGRAATDIAGIENLKRAAKEFELAVSLDSSNAAAHAGLADTTHMLGEAGHLGAWDEWMRQSKEFSLRALELDPNLADAHVSLGSILYHEYDYVGAEKELQLALSLNPSNSLGHWMYATLLADEGRSEEANREYALREESEAHSPYPLAQHAWFLVRLRRLDEAWVVLERWRELGATSDGYHRTLARYYGARSEFAHAFRELDQIKETHGFFTTVNVRVWLYVLSRDREAAQRRLGELEQEPGAGAATAKIDQTDIGATAAELAFCHGVLGNLDRCFAWLGKAFEAHDFWPQQWLGEPALAAVRRDPRFAQLLRRMNLTYDAVNDVALAEGG